MRTGNFLTGCRWRSRASRVLPVLAAFCCVSLVFAAPASAQGEGVGQGGTPPGQGGSPPGQAQPSSSGGGPPAHAQANGQTGSGGGGGAAAPAQGPAPAGAQPLSTGCEEPKDPADPGSCQEQGGGNSGDIDPNRGADPDSDTTPDAGNDCDEGGGNNRGDFPRRTNPSNGGDSDVDDDRGRGNNRCGPQADRDEPPEVSPDEEESPPVSGAIPPSPQLEVASLQGSTPDESGGGADNGGRFASTVSDDLPLTGSEVLWTALAGALLGGLGLGLRRLVAERA